MERHHLLKLGHLLKECTRIEVNNCLMQGHSAAERKKRHEEFLTLCNTEGSHEISSHALHSLHHRNFNKPLVLPLAEDVKQLHSFLLDNAEMTRRSLYEEVQLLPGVNCVK